MSRSAHQFDETIAAMAVEAPSIGEKEIHEVANGPFLAQGSDSWVDLLPKTDHVDLFRSIDFTATPLGPKSLWGPALRFYVSMVFNDIRPASLYWGPERVAIYNEGFIALASDQHPFMLGKSLKAAFPDVWEATASLFDQAVTTRKTIDLGVVASVIERHGHKEECYFVGQFMPVPGDDGHIRGVYNSAFESTSSVLHERRKRVVELIASIPISSLDATFGHIMSHLRANPADIPIAMLYSYDELAAPGSDDLRLVGSIGIPNGHSCAPVRAHLGSDGTGVVPFLCKALDSGAPVIISDTDVGVNASMSIFDGVEWSGHGEPSKHVLVTALSSGKRKLGFFVQGINSRRPYDHSVEMSIIDTARQIEARWASSITAEDARQREEILEQKLTDSERRLRHVAQSAPVGMCQVSSEGIIEWANDYFYAVTGIPRDKCLMSDFAEYVHPEDRERCLSDFAKLATGETSTTSELRLLRRWSPPPGELNDGEDSTDVPAWVLTNALAVRENGQVTQILGYITDVSGTKWGETVQARNAAAATLARRRQEEFIDMTSHEMRNPLSAITQLADGIARSFDEPQNIQQSAEHYKAILQDNVASANVVLACAAHQKRVIDDVLILSRLESEMLSITPVVVQPETTVNSVIQMFKGEAVMNDISIEARKDESYDNLHVDHVLCDTSRLTQILINLISNAIKFTASCDERKITVVYGARNTMPPRVLTRYGDLNWVSLRNPDQVQVSALPPAKHRDDILCLYFAVQDTGPGLTSVEMQRLFKRFSQANSKTHISYGGSGLGLYISKELAEKQGGQMGVASRRGEGATFAFYIETRKANAPRSELEMLQHHIPNTKETSETPQSATLPISSKGANEKESRETTNRTTNGVSPPHISGPANDHDSERMITSPQGGQACVPSTAFNIILVEDNLVNQKVLAKQLRKAGCTVAIANHGLEALELLKQVDCWSDAAGSAVDHAQLRQQDHETNAALKVDVILMDWEMPKMDGLSCTVRIRELEREGRLTRRLPVIATTANVRQEQMDQALAAGMDSVMSKPFSVDEVLTRIRETLESEAAKTGAPPETKMIALP